MSEHSCEKCGATIENGVPFCPSCNEPQIRVRGNPLAPPTAAGQLPLAATAVNWAQAMPGVLIAGLLLAVSMTIPVAPHFLLMMVAGAVAVALYARRSPLPLTPKMGARIGMTGGLFGWLAVVGVLGMEIALGGRGIVSMLREQLQQQIANYPNQAAQQYMSWLTTSRGLMLILAFGLLIVLVVALVCGALGGALAAWMMAKRKEK